MLIIRPIHAGDLNSLLRIAEESGPGFTSLPADIELLKRKIARAEASFSNVVEKPTDEGYLMVLEDTAANEVVGTCAIEAAVGINESLFHFRLGSEEHHSNSIDVHQKLETLTLCHDYTGASELCSLFLRQAYRQGHTGRMLSRSRFLFLAQHPERFSETIIAEMRGVNDIDGHSPFYDWLQKHFLGIDFIQADYLSGLGKKSLMAEVMPHHSVYVCLLPQEAQRVIGQVHRHTRPALSLLQAEGFRCRGYVDIFDAGPTVECRLAEIRAVRESRLFKVLVGEMAKADTQFILANTQVAEYRATCASFALDWAAEQVVISPQLADALLVNNADYLRILPL